ncbi:MAG: serine/threonine protein phosphatase [Isosphaeraceae bacterium]|nr:serine/threonine protein phosphatase [Isosphaeraceae bacterium]
MPDPQKILATIQRATDLFRRTPGRSGAVVSLDSAADVLVVGDLHGHIHTFAQVLKLAALDKNPRRHLVLQELVHDPRTDVDSEKGDLSHRLVDLVCALKVQYPDRVHLILGNHELSELTDRSILKNGVPLNALFQKGLVTSYGARAGEIRRAYLDLFRALPLGVRTPNRVFLVHTIPDGRDLDSLDWGVLAADDWPPEALARGGSVYALTWGRDTSLETSDRFAELVDADLLIIGHHPLDEGFRIANPRLLILDGTDPSPACCLFPAQGPITIETLRQGTRIVPISP